MSIYAFVQRCYARAASATRPTWFAQSAWKSMNFGSDFTLPFVAPYRLLLAHLPAISTQGSSLITKTSKFMRQSSELRWKAIFSKSSPKIGRVAFAVSIAKLLYPSSMEEIYEIDKLVPRGEMTGSHIGWLESTLVAAILRLPDEFWPANWDFLAQSMLRVAFKRVDDDDPRIGLLTTTYILEQLLEKRKLLPNTQRASSVTIIACTELYKRLFADKEYDKAISVSKIHLKELSNVQGKQVAEQMSLVYFQLAACSNMQGKVDDAQKYLTGAFSCFQLDKLPPRRFMAHLKNLIALCHYHQLFDRPPEGKSFEFFQFARMFYEKLDVLLPGLKVDHPWKVMIANIEAEMEEQATETQENIELEQDMEQRLQTQRVERMQAASDWMQYVGANPDFTARQKIAALRCMILQFDLSPEETKRLNTIIRHMRAVEKIPADFVPSPKKTPNKRY